MFLGNIFEPVVKRRFSAYIKLCVNDVVTYTRRLYGICGQQFRAGASCVGRKSLSGGENYASLTIGYFYV